MNKRDENRNRMILAVSTVVTKFRDLWESIPVFVAIVGELNEKQLKVEELRNVAESDITGRTRDKNDLEEKVLQSVYTISSGICVMAKRAGNQDLLKKTDYTISELSMAREGELIGICQNIAALGREHIDLLEGSGIDEASMTELEELTAEMKEMIAVPRVSISERKAANKALKEEIDAIVDILEEQLDRMMIRFKSHAPGFFAEYMNARHIVAYGIRHESGDDEAAA